MPEEVLYLLQPCAGQKSLCGKGMPQGMSRDADSREAITHLTPEASEYLLEPVLGHGAAFLRDPEGVMLVMAHEQVPHRTSPGAMASMLIPRPRAILCRVL